MHGLRFVEDLDIFRFPKMKQKTYTIYNIYDVGGEMTITMSRQEAKDAFSKGLHVVEQHVTDNRVSIKIRVTTTVAKEW